jgi:hypothetical protein
MEFREASFPNRCGFARWHDLGPKRRTKWLLGELRDLAREVRPTRVRTR